MEQEQVQVQKEENEEQKKRKKRLQELRKKEEEHLLNLNIDRIKQELQEESRGYNDFLERLRKLGIIVAQVYHCRRCNHIWVPRDYNPVFYSPYFMKDEYMLESMKPPKACARCKSRYWNLPPKRKTKRTSLDKSEDRLVDLMILGGMDKLNIFGHDMITAPRLRAFIKNQSKILTMMDKIAREKGIELEDTRIKPRKITLQELRERNKRLNDILNNVRSNKKDNP
jgi:hypothetical protein